MRKSPDRVIDMTLDGQFRAPEPAAGRAGAPVATRLALWMIVLAVMAGGLAIAALALYLAFILIPVALAAAAIGYVAFRFQLWRARGSLGRQRNVSRF